MLMAYLAVVQERYSESSGFWLSRDLCLEGPSEDGLRGSVCQFAPGRFQHVIQLPAVSDHFPKAAFGTIIELDPKITKAVCQDIDRFWEFLKAQDDYREAITVVLVGGWGGGLELDLNLDEEQVPDGWRFLYLSFSEAVQLGACEDGKLRHLWRVVEQVDILRHLGYSVGNVNGTINLLGNWRETGGQFIPEHFVDMEPPFNLMMPTDGLFRPRIEAIENMDLRTLPFTDGTYKRVQRTEWQQYGRHSELKPIYGSIDDIASRRLLGAVAIDSQVWWIETVRGQPDVVSADWQYQMWNAAIQWLAAIAPQIILDFASVLPSSPRYVCLEVGESEVSYNGEVLEELDPYDFLERVFAADGSAKVVMKRQWIEALRRPRNDAEVALATSLLEQILSGTSERIEQKDIVESVRRAIPSSDWRWLHSGEVKTLIERMSAAGLLRDFREIPRSALALVKCGSVWKFHDRANGYEFSGDDECRNFLKAYNGFVLSELIARIKEFNRTRVILASAARYQAGRAEQRSWRVSIRALRSIRGTVADETALERESAINVVQRAAKIICEIAACEAPEDGDATPGDDDLDEMYARALLLFGNGQLYACIRAGIVPPHLKISPAGDLLSDRSIFEKTMLPAAVRQNIRTLDSAAADYAVRNSQQMREEQEALTWSDELRNAVEKEFSASAEAFVDFQFTLLQMVEERREGEFIAQRSDIAANLAKNENYPATDATSMLARLTLKRRNSWHEEADWLTPRDLDLSRFDRPNSLINRPLLALNDDADPLVLIAPIVVRDAALYAISGLHEGSLHNEFWSHSASRKYAGLRADELGREFEDTVAKVLNDVGFSASARESISGLLEQAIEEDLGDVDVFAISADRASVFAIEAKNLRFCRTEGEIAARMTEYQGGMRTNSRGVEKPDKMLRHLRRVRYLRDNAARLGECLRLPGTPAVYGVMVMDAPQPMNFHALTEDPDATSCMLEDLVALIRGQQG